MKIKSKDVLSFMHFLTEDEKKMIVDFLTQ